MAYENFIGLRYLMAKQRGCVVSVITFLSVAGVTLGVTAMIVVLSVMGGFKQDLKEKILGTKAHMVVEPAEGEVLEDPEEVLEVARGVDGLVAGAGFLEAEVMASSPTNLNGVMMRGIDPDRIGDVSDLDTALLHEKARGRLSNLEHPGWSVSKLRRKERETPEGLESIRNKLDEESIEETGIGDFDGGMPGTLVPPGDAGSRPPIPPPGSRGDAGMVAPGPAGPKPSGANVDSGGGPGGELPEELDPLERNEPVGNESGSESSEVFQGGGEPDAGGAGEMPSVVPEGDSRDDEGGAEMPPVAGEEDGGDSESDMPSVTGDDGDAPEPAQAPGILIGKELADRLKVGIGDEINVVTPEGEMGPSGPIPRSRPFRVVGVFYTGMYEYDSRFAYAELGAVQDFLGKSGVTGVELKAERVSRAIPLANELQSRLPEGYDVRDWKEMNRSLFLALKLEKIAMFLVLTLIIAVASFSIIAMLIMIVLEKKQDISVLKSMGVTDWGIMRIFIYQGVVIGAVGAAVGLVLGLTICYLLVVIGWPLNTEVYYIQTLPVDVDAFEVTLVVLATVGISFLATIYPSWKAAQLTPVEGLRYE